MGNQHSICKSDRNVMYVSSGPLSPSALPGLETTFQQDLHIDGTIALPLSTIIDSGDATCFPTRRSSYLQLLDASNCGPTVNYAGAPVTVGSMGGWTPIGAEKVGS